MRLHYTLLAVLAAAVASASVSAHVHKGRSLLQQPQAGINSAGSSSVEYGCGTRSVDVSKRVEFMQRLMAYRAAQAASGQVQSVTLDDKITVPVAFTVVEPNAGDEVVGRQYDRPTEAQLAAQVKVMNDIFSGVRTKGNSHGVDTKFRFKRCMTRFVEDTDWYTAPDQFMVQQGETKFFDFFRKRANHVGGTGTLNMYIKELNLGPPNSGNLSGIATFPWEMPGPNQLINPMEDYAVANDGTTVAGFALPGATLNGAPITKFRMNHAVAAHEAGHWLSAYHTFEGTERNDKNECTETVWPDLPSFTGDTCDDTPVMFKDHDFSCESAQDSCPNLPGKDPIFNVMNYMIDECLLGMTKDQTTMMRDAWKLIRAPGANNPKAKPDDFTDVSISSPTSLDIFKNDVSNLVPAAPFLIDDLSWTITREPSKGTLTVNKDGSRVIYTPGPDAAAGGTDMFRYRAFDCNGESNTVDVNIKFAGGQQASPSPSPSPKPSRSPRPSKSPKPSPLPSPVTPSPVSPSPVSPSPVSPSPVSPPPVTPSPTPVPAGPCPYLRTPVCVEGKTGYRSATCSPTNYCLPHLEGGFCRYFFKPQGTACWVTMWGPKSSVRANTTKEYLRPPRGFTDDGFAVKAGGEVDTQTWSSRGSCDMGVCRTNKRRPRW